jgi:hypothetical protein
MSDLHDLAKKIGTFYKITSGSNNKEQWSGIKDGIFSDGAVLVNGIPYPSESTSDKFIAEGDNVKCLFSDDKSMVIVL